MSNISSVTCNWSPDPGGRPPAVQCPPCQRSRPQQQRMQQSLRFFHSTVFSRQWPSQKTRSTFLLAIMRGSHRVAYSYRRVANLIDARMFPGSIAPDNAAEALHYGICSLSAICASYSRAIVVNLYKMISRALSLTHMLYTIKKITLVNACLHVILFVIY